jgi:hypothetical protein
MGEYASKQQHGSTAFTKPLVFMFVIMGFTKRLLTLFCNTSGLAKITAQDLYPVHSNKTSSKPLSHSDKRLTRLDFTLETAQH